MKLKNILLIILALIMCFSVLGCSDKGTEGGDTSSESSALGDAKHHEHIKKFFSAVGESDFEEAQKLLHPSSKISPKEYFTEKGESLQIDFFTGIEFRRFTGWATLDLDGKQIVDYNVMLVVEDTRVYGNIGVLDDGDGFGVYVIDLYY